MHGESIRNLYSVFFLIFYAIANDILIIFSDPYYMIESNPWWKLSCLERRFPTFPFYPQYNDSSSCWAFWFFFLTISYISVKKVKFCHHVKPMWESFFFNLIERERRERKGDRERERSASRWIHFWIFIMIIWLFSVYILHFINGLAS